MSEKGVDPIKKWEYQQYLQDYYQQTKGTL